MENTKEGYVYALINPAMPGYVKIGMTTRSIDERIKELSSSTGVPYPYVCAYSIEVNDCHQVEKELHNKFSNYRANNNREFFKIDIKDIIREMITYENNNYSLINNKLTNLNIGLDYYYGHNGFDKNEFEARKYFDLAIYDGDYEAYIYLAEMQFYGESTFEKSTKNAIDTLILAVENEIDEAYSHLGNYYALEDEIENSLYYWEKYIESNNTLEYMRDINYYSYIEFIYYTDYEIKNIEKIRAIRNKIMKYYLEKTIENEDLRKDKEFYIFLNYQLGDFSTKEINILRSEIYEGNMKDKNYEKEYVEENDSKSETISDFDIGENYFFGLSDCIKDERIALKYFKQAIKNGDFRGYYHLGNMYRYGDGGLKESIPKALDSFILGIENGIYDCYSEMAKIYDNENSYENAYKCWINYLEIDNYFFDWNIGDNYLNYIYHCYLNKNNISYNNKLIKNKEDIYSSLSNKIKYDNSLKEDIRFFEFLQSIIGNTDNENLTNNYRYRQEKNLFGKILSIFK